MKIHIFGFLIGILFLTAVSRGQTLSFHGLGHGYGANFQTAEQSRKTSPKPPLKFGKMAAQFTVGALGGLLGNLYWVDKFENTRVSGDAGYNLTRHYMMLLSSIAATSLGIFLVGNVDETHGSYLATALGCLIGSFPQMMFINNPYYLFGAVTFGLLFQTGAGLIAYNLSRTYDRSPAEDSGSALLHLHHRRLHATVPAVRLYWDRQQQQWVYSIPLLHISL